jgi:hypothetical protein
MRRWFKEFLRPSKKCARVGHRPYESRRTVWFYPPQHGWSAVADQATEVTTRCSRCGKHMGTELLNLRGIQGLTMPAAHMDELHEKGRFPA